MPRLPLEDLVFDDALWPRVKLDQARVEHLADALRAGQQLPPIKVQQDTSLVLGGRHTVLACRLLGEPTYFIEFVDIEPSQRLLYAYREDMAAALPYTDADVKSVAQRLYELQCTNGDIPNVSLLAASLGRSRQTVDRWVADLVAARERSLEVKRGARIVAIQAFTATGKSVRQIALLMGIPKSQVSRDAQVGMMGHLADSEVVTEAQNLIHLTIGSGATLAETDAARDWLIAQTDPDELARRERQRAWRALASELDTWALRAPVLTIPPVVDDAFREPVRQAVASIEAFLLHLKARVE